MTAGQLVLISALGGAGAAARFLVDTAVRAWRDEAMPWGTLVVNLSGSLLIGVLAGLHAAGGLSAEAYALGALGFCGGYTTFSTAMVECVRLLQMNDMRRATVSVLGTLLTTCLLAGLGLAAAALVS